MVWCRVIVVILGTANGTTEATETAKEDEPLFVDDESDFDMDEILRGSQERRDTDKDISTATITATTTAQPSTASTAPVERDEFEDEMEAMGDMDFDLL